jgi:dUTP pyrophosphatase
MITTIVKVRGFEKISKEQYLQDMNSLNINSRILSKEQILECYNNIKLPRRATKKSSGYDFYSPLKFKLHPNEIIKIPTGIKATMKQNEELKIFVRSSMGFKYNIRLCNQVGKIDSDYYNNESNEGHIWIALKNEGNKSWIVKVGDGIAQGSFYNYLITDDDIPISEERIGGIGSTGK